jgi:hypothetical protein
MPKDKAVPPAPDPEETAQQTAQPTKRKPAHGKGQLLTGGMPGNKGGPGRPKKVVIEHMARTLEGKKSMAATARILNDPNHPAHAAVWKTALAYTEGLPNKLQDPDGAGLSGVMLVPDLG